MDHPTRRVGYRGPVSKKTQRRASGTSTTSTASTAEESTENPRRPCPCGSGKRYKACHGAADAADMIITRPFAGLAAETELIALREFVPSASAPLTLLPTATDVADRSVTLASVLPGAAAALTRSDGSVLLGMQVQTHSGDLSRDLAAALEWALAAEPSTVLSVVGRASLGPRLDDMVVDKPLEVTVHPDFSWWLEEEAVPGSEVALSLERANSAITPTTRVAGLPGAYWVDAGDRAHLRWVRPEDEQPLMAALARLAVADELGLGEGSRYVGSFRAHGRLVPVWDLDHDAHPTEWDAPALAFAGRLQQALESDAPLNDAERRARDGILGRQVTLR
jgi:hypothetical protein